jgi:hypothetical protein
MILTLNKMILSLSQKLPLVTIVFISLLKCINCDCGPPGIPYRVRVYPENKSSFPENYEIKYECEAGNALFYNTSRICIEGKWAGRVPKCDNY